MKNKILIFILLVAVLCVTTACSERLVDIKYDLQSNGDELLKKNTTMYDDAIQCMTEEYVLSNKTVNVGTNSEDLPAQITRIIKSKDEFNIAFKGFPQEIDFDKQMIVLYFFTANNIIAKDGKRLRYYELHNVINDKGAITLECILNKTDLRDRSDELWPILDTTKPTQNCLAFVMPKMMDVQFEFKISDTKVYYKSWRNDLKSNAKLYNADIAWLRDEYRESKISDIIYPQTIIDKIQTRTEFVNAFKKFYNNYNVNKDMLVLYYFTESNSNTSNSYTYSIADIQYDKGYIDIIIDKKIEDTQKADNPNSTRFLVIKLPQLPAHKINITIK